MNHPPDGVEELSEPAFQGRVSWDGEVHDVAVVYFDSRAIPYQRSYSTRNWHIVYSSSQTRAILLAWANHERNKATQAFREVAEGLERERVLREQLAVVRTDSDGVWRWIGDGNDDPKSLACPVVMSPATLRSMLADRDKAELDAIAIALAARSLLESLGEYVRQSMHLNPEWRSGIVAVESALGFRGVRAEVQLNQAIAEGLERERSLREQLVVALSNSDVTWQWLQEVQARAEGAEKALKELLSAVKDYAGASSAEREATTRRDPSK